MGYNAIYGQLGDGTLGNRAAFVFVTGSVVDVAAGLNESIYAKANGEVFTSGRNQYGQLGNASTTDSLGQLTKAKIQVNTIPSLVSVHIQSDAVRSASIGNSGNVVTLSFVGNETLS